MKNKQTERASHPFRPAALSLALIGIGMAAPVPDSLAQGELDEIIVTAQRREENLQDVPISVVAFSGDALARSGVESTMGMPELVPSVQVARSGPSATFFIRGVGNTSAGTGEQGTNAFYVDGVYIADLKQTAMKFNNIERIEVLKGPQGTLFGRNSSGGLVNVITHDPGDDLTAKVNLGFADYDTYSGQAYLAGPVSETVSADIALTATDQQDGWGRDLVTGKDVSEGWDWGIRSKWVWRPSDTIKVSLAGDYNKSSDTFGSSFRLAPGSVGRLGDLPPDDVYDTDSGEEQFIDLESYGVHLTAEFDLDWATLTSITGFRELQNESALDSDMTPPAVAYIEVNDTEQSLQQELRLASHSDGALNWQVGLFLLSVEAELDPQRHTGLAFQLNPNGDGEYDVISSLDTVSYAAFGELSWDLTSTTQLTAGLRYTRDELDFDGSQLPINASTAIPRSVDESSTETEPTYRLVLRQDITEDMNVYVSYNRGFKSGTYSMSSIFVDPVEPQTIDAYELGLKSQLLENRLRLNLAAYHYDIDDYQVRSATADTPSPILLNATQVDIDGLEVEFELLATDNFRLFGSATWLDAQFDDFRYAPFSYPSPAVCTPDGPGPGMSTGDPLGGNTVCIGDASGNDAPIAPEFAGSLGAMYTLLLGSAGAMDFALNYSYNDGYYFEPDNRLSQSSFGLLNASISYRPSPNWSVEIWGRNLEDEEYFAQKLAVSSLGDNAVPLPPRTYGINLRYEY